MRNRLLKTLILAVAIAGISASGALAQTASDQEKVEKARIERQVRKEILSLPYYGVFDAIGYELKDGVVTLSGYVVRPYTKKDAGAAVADVKGVKQVVNNIEVLPPSPSDDRIRVRAYRAISNQGSLYRYLLGASPSMRIVVNRGRITLEGMVAYESDKMLAEVAATEIFGVFSVKNNLQIERREGEEVQ